mgnify:CR=1 FL=1
MKTDCLYFNGYKPCKYHKQEGVHCEDCPHYRPFNKKILIIKLQAAGEVIRNTPLLHKLNELYPDSRIFWLTNYPELIPKQYTHKVMKWEMNSILSLLNIEFDLVLSLDKDLEACSLANMIKAKEKKGFSQKDGVIVPFDEDCRHKWKTGVYDDLMKFNTKHYVEELFEICGFKWQGEEYILPEYTKPNIEVPKDKPVIGLNTGAGAAWVTRRFSEQRWLSLIECLKQSYNIILLGGPDEDEMNKRLAELTGAHYYGTFPFKEFIGLVDECDLIITSVTLALHIAIGLKKKIILLNNIFPSNEFHLYGLGKILEPDLSCRQCYKSKFDENCHTENCLDLIENDTIKTTIEEIL